MHEPTLFYPDDGPYAVLNNIPAVYVVDLPNLNKDNYEKFHVYVQKDETDGNYYEYIMMKHQNDEYYYECLGSIGYEEELKPTDIVHPVICTQCGGSFKLAYDGTGKCPYCDTYYSKYEIK